MPSQILHSHPYPVGAVIEIREVDVSSTLGDLGADTDVDVLVQASGGSTLGSLGVDSTVDAEFPVDVDSTFGALDVSGDIYQDVDVDVDATFGDLDVEASGEVLGGVDINSTLSDLGIDADLYNPVEVNQADLTFGDLGVDGNAQVIVSITDGPTLDDLGVDSAVDVIITVDVDTTFGDITVSSSGETNVEVPIEADADITLDALEPAIDITHTLEYRINKGTWQNSAVFSSLSPGEYLVEVRSKNTGCVTSQLITIASCDLTASIESVTDETDKCDGSITFSWSSTASEITWTINGLRETTTSESPVTIPDLCPGDYEIVIIDEFDCQTTLTATVN